MVHLTVSPTLIVIEFGLNAKATIELATVFEVWTVVVVGLAAVVFVAGLAVVVVVGSVVVVDPLVVLAEVGGLVGWLVDDGWTVWSVDRSATVDKLSELTVVVVVAEPDGGPHAATSSERTATTANHLKSPVSPLIQNSPLAHTSRQLAVYTREAKRLD